MFVIKRVFAADSEVACARDVSTASPTGHFLPKQAYPVNPTRPEK